VLTRTAFILTFLLAVIVNCNAVAPSIVNSSPLYNGSIGVTYNLQLLAIGGGGRSLPLGARFRQFAVRTDAHQFRVALGYADRRQDVCVFAKSQ